MSGPIVRKYGFPNFEKIFGERPILHGEPPEEAPKQPSDPDARKPAEPAEPKSGTPARPAR